MSPEPRRSAYRVADHRGLAGTLARLLQDRVHERERVGATSAELARTLGWSTRTITDYLDLLASEGRVAIQRGAGGRTRSYVVGPERDVAGAGRADEAGIAGDAPLPGVREG